MHRVLIAGAGKMGSLIASLLSRSGDYQVYLTDIQNTSHPEIIPLDATDKKSMQDFLKKNPVDTIISSLPFYCNKKMAELALEFKLNYFDLTEDTETTRFIMDLAKNAKTAFVPQCGLAPGFISIVTHELMRHFEAPDIVKMRVGALPADISNTLQYAFTWSPDGLINEYGNACHAIVDGHEMELMPLDDLEEIKIDGLTYEAFNTSGGIGSLADTWKTKVKMMNYKTIRYPGHCEKMRFLMNDLRLNEDRGTLKRILEHAIPHTAQDVVLVYISVTGIKNNAYSEENYVKKFYPQKLHDTQWTAIQLTTASEICAMLDIIVKAPQKYQGFIKQEQISFSDLTHNRFGKIYV